MRESARKGRDLCLIAYSIGILDRLLQEVRIVSAGSTLAVSK